ncbi:sugar phosphate nucleotidyltransferase [Galactobacillus timonensis]|jgi:UTP-glucose-1-phosphate uridylyltransferase|uniref:nucleotidyltransferase family protein n=1 Tax=Galactobacillus timonensis TaxID=2041840 RepID=UPI002409EEB3|nr:sugar phosphate nucleotidyltransferase [Galactobacillus timonensis]MDD6369232.1 sugar phosphate nucleotidyltransferase [Galactobacillus timonensis]
MSIKPTLVILAAGMGSRYGGMKQIDGVGSHGEPIIEFSIYDAYKAGFRKVVLIIKREHEELFRKALTDRVANGGMEVDFAYQDMNNIPEGFSVPEGRVKPWGTTHALLACKGIVNEPFAIINADDFYGRNAYEVIYRYLTTEVADDNYAMVGFKCLNTLTANGTVTRGLCQQKDGCLSAIQEIQKIALKDGHAIYEDNGEWKPIADDALVSMNFWGFTPKIFDEMEPLFKDFLAANIEKNPLKCEHVIPTGIGTLVSEGKIKVHMLSSSDKWFGVTYKEDKPEVVARIQALKDNGTYPDVLWK